MSETKRGKVKADAFIKHLEDASRIVATWPKWKQELLGGVASVELITPIKRKAKNDYQR